MVKLYTNQQARLQATWRRTEEAILSDYLQPARPERRWTRPRFIVPMLVALALLAGGAFWLAPQFSSDPAPLPVAAAPASSPAPTPSESYGIPPYGGLTDAEFAAQLENERATRVKTENPDFFKCRKYPAGDALKPADLVPTANVNIVFSFDKKKGTYVYAADKRVRMTVRAAMESGDDGKPFPAQRFTWYYTGSAKMFTTSSYGEDFEGNWKWGGYGASPTNDGGYVLSLAKADGPRTPHIVVIGTDPRTCKAGSITLPDEKRIMRDLGESGLLQPQM